MSDQLLCIRSVSELNKLIGVETLHPLLSVVDFSKCNILSGEFMLTTDLYAVIIKDCYCGEIKYGRNKYDYQDETMVFFSPKQSLQFDSKSQETQSKGWGLFFHPDLLRGTSLSTTIKNHHYFSYSSNEALHLSAEERRMIRDCFYKIEAELNHPIDKHSKHLIVSNIELLLGYCLRFYDRQFITREIINKDILSKFETILTEYIDLGKASQNGLLTVKYCADKLNLSPNYFGDLVKKESGSNAQEHIQYMIMERAKTELTTTSKSISEIAHSLGFEYPHYFSRQFKKRVGVSPNEYRAMS